MDKFKEIWEPVVKSFSWAYPQYYEEMVDWYPSGHLEIMVKLRSGKRIIYEFVGDYIHFVKDQDYELEGFDEEIWRKNFANCLNAKMRKLGISRDRLSELSGISQVTLTKYTSGKASPSGYNIERLARALKCSQAELTRFR